MIFAVFDVSIIACRR